MKKPILQPRDHLSDNFTYIEMVRSQTAARYDLNNHVYSERVITNARYFAKNVLEPLRDYYGSFSPNSWYRSEALERQITYPSYQRWCGRKGVPVNQRSWDKYFKRKSHPKGGCADIEIAGVPNDTLFAWIGKNLVYDQLIREFPRKGDPYSGWVHVSFSISGNRRQKFTIN